MVTNASKKPAKPKKGTSKGKEQGKTAKEK